MVSRYTDDEDGNDDLTADAAEGDGATDGSDIPSEGADDVPVEEPKDVPTAGTDTNRRTFMKAVGVATALGGAGVFASSASAAGFTTDPSGEVTVDPGEYSWDGSSLDVGSGDALVGGGSAGDVVVNLESGTMQGSVEGRLENIVVRGSNPESKSGVDLSPGATVDGFVWPEGGQQSEDRALYTPDGGNDRLTIRNSAWANCVNNGAYVDKPPVTMENCASINNNIAGVRVGHRDGTDESETTYVRNTLVAVTADIGSDDTNSPNARGLRLRKPANLVVENCWFVYLDVDGPADLIELHDGAAGSSVTIRNCTFYNDSGGDLVRDKSGGEIDVTIENCTVAGSGSRTVEPDYDGSGISEVDSVSVPLPSEITGYAAADDVEGVGGGAPWDGSVSVGDGGSDEEGNGEGTTERTLVLHASPDNDGDVDVSVTVDGELAFASEAESGTDTIESNGDGTTTATSVGLDPDALDSYYLDGEVVDYSVPSGATVDVSLDGTTTTFAELVGEDDSTDGGSGDGGSGDDGSSDGGSDDGGSGDDGSSDGGSDDGGSGDGGSGSDDGGSGDGGSGSDDGSSAGGELPHRISVDGTADDEVTTYTFTVSGEVERDPTESVVTEDGSPYDRIQDVASEGKVIGLVGSGIDAYRFDGELTALTVDGEATLSIEQNV